MHDERLRISKSGETCERNSMARSNAIFDHGAFCVVALFGTRDASHNSVLPS